LVRVFFIRLLLHVGAGSPYHLNPWSENWGPLHCPWQPRPPSIRDKTGGAPAKPMLQIDGIMTIRILLHVPRSRAGRYSYRGFQR
jgi:hypothetical protein